MIPGQDVKGLETVDVFFKRALVEAQTSDIEAEFNGTTIVLTKGTKMSVGEALTIWGLTRELSQLKGKK